MSATKAMKKFTAQSESGVAGESLEDWFDNTIKVRISLCMGVVKLDDAPNWDVERMAREKP
jgi:hypothetical protein